MVEREPDTENVVYLDEFPELKKQVWLRRLNTQRNIGSTGVNGDTKVFKFPEKPDPNDAA